MGNARPARFLADPRAAVNSLPPGGTQAVPSSPPFPMQIDARCPPCLRWLSDDALADAVTWLTGLCLRDGWPALDSLAATLVLEEALTNILGLASPAQEHAGLVRLRFTRGCGIAALRIMDNGPPFDPGRAAPPACPVAGAGAAGRARLAPDAPTRAQCATGAATARTSSRCSSSPDVETPASEPLPGGHVCPMCTDMLTRPNTARPLRSRHRPFGAGAQPEPPAPCARTDAARGWADAYGQAMACWRRWPRRTAWPCAMSPRPGA